MGKEQSSIVVSDKAKLQPLALGIQFGSGSNGPQEALPPKLWIFWIDDAWFHGLHTDNKKCVFAPEENGSLDAQIEDSKIICSDHKKYNVLVGGVKTEPKFFNTSTQWNYISEVDKLPKHENTSSDSECLKAFAGLVLVDIKGLPIQTTHPIGLILLSFEGFLKWRKEIRELGANAFIIFDVKHQAAKQQKAEFVASDFKTIGKNWFQNSGSTDHWDALGLALCIEEMAELKDRQFCIPFRMGIFTSLGEEDNGKKVAEKNIYSEFTKLIRAYIGTNNSIPLIAHPRIWWKVDTKEKIGKAIWDHAQLLWDYKIEAWKEIYPKLNALPEYQQLGMEEIEDAWWSSLQGPKEDQDRGLHNRHQARTAFSKSGVLPATIPCYVITAVKSKSELGNGFQKRWPHWTLPDKPEEQQELGIRHLERALQRGPVLLLLEITERKKPSRSLKRAVDLIRRFRTRLPELTILVGSAIHGKRVEEALYRAGADAVYHGGGYSLRSALEPNELNGNRAWADFWSHHQARFQVPDCVGATSASFVDCSAPDWRAEYDELKDKLGIKKNPAKCQEVERLLRALFPDAESLRIVKVLSGGGTQGVPFVVAARSANGQESKSVQVKLHPEWRAIDEERRGFEEVIIHRLGSSVAHIVRGPMRLGDWAGIVQSFASREDSGPESDCAPQSLQKALETVLAERGKPQALAGELFRQLLTHLYGKGKTAPFPCLRLLSKQGPAILNAEIINGSSKANEVLKFDPLDLSRKNRRHQALCASKTWRHLFKEISSKEIIVEGWQLKEIENAEPGPAKKQRVRFLDQATGLKIDAYTNNAEHAAQIQSLIDSPLPTRDLQPLLKLKAMAGWKDATNLREDGKFNPWMGLRKELKEVGVAPDKALYAEGNMDPFEWLWKARPLDWYEDFRLGPVHGDLNLGNVLVTDNDGRRSFSMIDFDQAENDYPIAFDLAKLEWEALTKIGARRIYALKERLSNVMGAGKKQTSLAQLTEAIERAAVSETPESLEGILQRLGLVDWGTDNDPLCRELDGYLEWRRAVAAEGAKLGVDHRQRIHALFLYGFATLKFKNMRDHSKTGCGAAPAEIALYCIQTLILELDELDGVRKNSDIAKWIGELRKLKKNKFSIVHLQSGEQHEKQLPKLSRIWKQFLTTFTAKHVSGEGRWMRELLWRIRDHHQGKLNDPAEVAALTLGMVWASEFPELDNFKKFKEELLNRFQYIAGEDTIKWDLHDFASTGRPGNIFPTGRFFQDLCESKSSRNLLKISSRGDSGGTIDVLEQAGLPLSQCYNGVSVVLAAKAKAKKEAAKNKPLRVFALAEPGQNLCSVDKALMDLRRKNGCMDCGDLAIASVMAKKLCVGISSFDVELVTGYDSKFEELIKPENGALESVKNRWNAVWTQVKNGGGLPVSDNLQFVSSDSGKLEWSWEGEDVYQIVTDKNCPILFSIGSLWLAVGAIRKFFNDVIALDSLKDHFDAALHQKFTEFWQVGQTISDLVNVESHPLQHGDASWTVWPKAGEFFKAKEKELGVDDARKREFIKEFDGASVAVVSFSKKGGSAFELNPAFLDGFYSEHLSKTTHHPWSGMVITKKNGEGPLICCIVAPETALGGIEHLAWEFVVGAQAMDDKGKQPS